MAKLPLSPRRYTRHVLMLAALLLAGAVINVLVAWGCARWGSHWRTGPQSEGELAEHEPDGVEAFLNDPEYARLSGKEYRTGLEASIICASSSSWACTRKEFTLWHAERSDGSRSHTLVQFGLPFRSLQYAEQAQWGAMIPNAQSSIDDWRLPGPSGGWAPAFDQINIGSLYGRPSRIYPLTPIPWGFAVNTILYAALAFALFFVSSAVRRRSRRRRGLCVKCAYPIGVSHVCTECGAPVQTRTG